MTGIHTPLENIQPKRKNWIFRHRRKIYGGMVWGSFFICLYILKTFISLMLLTFIMSYSINSLVNFLRSKFSWPRWGIILVVYGVLGILMLGVGMIVIPNVYHEGQTLSREIPQVLLREIPKAKEKLPEQLQVLVNSPEFSKFIEGLDLENTVRENFGDILQAVTVFFRDLLRISFYLILSMIFSFLILWDLERLKRDVKSLRDTRLQGVYHTITPHLVRLSDILGKAFEAQIVIAFANTVLTLIGLTFLGIPSKLFLSVFVFLCSFIPVLGVFISTIPICLLAYKAQGFILLFSSIILITIVHFVEAYILNPRIVGSHLSLHPFIAVSVLLISEQFFKVWGLLLGVPLAVFLFQSILVVEPPTLNSEIPQNEIEGQKKLQKSA